MSRPDLDAVLDYLSTRFNKIFCDREFVCCVAEDFQPILNNKNKSYVLVFPVLGPVYLKAVRYQARIFDLAVFTVGTGKLRSVAVCQKDLIEKKANEIRKDNMEASSSSLRRKRPERLLYVPPAQRRSLQSNTKTVKSDECSSKKGEAKKDGSHNKKKGARKLLTLKDTIDLFYNLNLFPYQIKYSPMHGWSDQYGKESSNYLRFLVHKNCIFRTLTNLRNNSPIFVNCVPFYNLKNCLSAPNYWQFNLNGFERGIHFKSLPLFNFNNGDNIKFKEKPLSILMNDELPVLSELDVGYDDIEDSAYKLVCDKTCDNCDLMDLSAYNLGHYFTILFDGDEYFYECQEDHDPFICRYNWAQNFKIYTAESNLIKTSVIKTDLIENHTNDISIRNECQNQSIFSNDKETIKNQINTNQKTNKNEHDEEKEIMRKTKEHINRRSRPIMKYCDDIPNDLIDKNDSVNNWEDLFDDAGQIQEELFTEIANKVGNEVTILKAAEDYSAYANKSMEDLEHVVELYNFPSTLETHDLVQAFSDIKSDAMYIKWVDDTHALLVLGSLNQAQKAISMGNSLIKVRPMTAASAVSMDVANKSDLKPAMKRPPTNLQTARRLITTHLGTKSKMSKEQLAKERQDLKKAKEMKKLTKQNEIDAWEGNIRSAVN